MPLNQDVDDVSILIDSPPEILSLALDLHEDLVQVPYVAIRPWRHLSFRAYPGPNFRHHCRMVSCVTVIPRFASSSSTSRKLRQNR